MFDTHIHRSAPNYSQSVHVKTTEQRAPTDESVRLLREMEEKARDSIFLSFRSAPNGFKCSTMVWANPMANVLMLRLHFRLNEIEFQRDIELPDSMRSVNREGWLLLIRDEIAKAIAGAIVIQLQHGGVSGKIEHFGEWR